MSLIVGRLYHGFSLAHVRERARAKRSKCQLSTVPSRTAVLLAIKQTKACAHAGTTKNVVYRQTEQANARERETDGCGGASVAWNPSLTLIASTSTRSKTIIISSVCVVAVVVGEITFGLCNNVCASWNQIRSDETTHNS